MSDSVTEPNKGFSLSFEPNKSKRQTKKLKINEDEDQQTVEYVTGFTEAGATLEGSKHDSISVNGTKKRIVPTQQNDLREFGPRKFNPNRFLPDKDEAGRPGEGEDRFEVAAPEVKVEMKYGLTSKTDIDLDQNPAEPSSSQPNSAASASLQRLGQGPKLTGRNAVGTGQDRETEAYKRHVESLPDQCTLENYEAMPVEAFGEAMLRGMGWSENSESTDAQAKEFVRRAPLLGLGATALPQSHKEKRFIRPGESRDPKKEMVVYSKDGHIKHTKTADEKLVERAVKGPAVGKTMRVLQGRHQGFLCTITAIHSQGYLLATNFVKQSADIAVAYIGNFAQVEGASQRATVRLRPSEESVSVRLKELGERDEQPAAKANGDKPHKPHKLHKSRKHPKDGSPDPDRLDALDHREEAEPSAKGDTGHAERPWLASHIRVKVVDKRLKDGRLYLKKGEITDVITPLLCSLLLDTGESIETQQHQLETIVPKNEGARILIVAGSFKGQRAKLLKRSSDSCQAAVQLLEDFSVHKVSFDEISEFVGDYGDEE